MLVRAGDVADSPHSARITVGSSGEPKRSNHSISHSPFSGHYGHHGRFGPSGEDTASHITRRWGAAHVLRIPRRKFHAIHHQPAAICSEEPQQQMQGAASGGSLAPSPSRHFPRRRPIGGLGEAQAGATLTPRPRLDMHQGTTRSPSASNLPQAKARTVDRIDAGFGCRPGVSLSRGGPVV